MADGNGKPKVKAHAGRMVPGVSVRQFGLFRDRPLTLRAWAVHGWPNDPSSAAASHRIVVRCNDRFDAGTITTRLGKPIL